MPADRLDHVRWVWPAYVTTVSFGVILRGAISDRVFEVELCDYDGWLGGRLGYFSDPWIVAVIYNRHQHRSHHRGSFKPCESHGTDTIGRGDVFAGSSRASAAIHLSSSVGIQPENIIIIGHDKRQGTRPRHVYKLQTK